MTDSAQDAAVLAAANAALKGRRLKKWQKAKLQILVDRIETAEFFRITRARHLGGSQHPTGSAESTHDNAVLSEADLGSGAVNTQEILWPTLSRNI